MTQQTCLLSDTADMSAVAHRRHVCCVTQQTMSALSQQKCLLWDTADMSAVCRNRHVCCVTQQTRHPCLRHEPLVLRRCRGGASPTMTTTQLTATVHARLTLRKTFVFRPRRGGLAPPPLRHINKVLCRQQSTGARYNIYCGINKLSWISTPA